MFIWIICFFESYLDIELLNILFYDSLKLRFGDYEDLLALDLFEFAIYWIIDFG